MNKRELDLLIQNFPENYLLLRYKINIENSNKKFSEKLKIYKEKIKIINQNGWLDVKGELDNTVDAYRKSVRKIEKEGIESVFKRKDIFELAISINPIYKNGVFNKKMFENYVKQFRLSLESVYGASFQNVFSERFPTDETLKKELSEYIKNYQSKIVNINSLVNKNNIYIVNVEVDNENVICIKCYRYYNKRIEIKEKITYKEKSLSLYLAAVNKGHIDYKVLQLRSDISKECQKRIKKMLKDLYYYRECYLMVSQFSGGVINSFIYRNYKKFDFQLVEGNIEELKK